MIIQAIILSLQITAIWVLFAPGNLLYPLRVAIANKLDKWMGKKNSIIAQKPLFDCLCCMSSVWTILLTLSIDIPLMLVVCGINCIIFNMLINEKNV